MDSRCVKQLVSKIPTNFNIRIASNNTAVPKKGCLIPRCNTVALKIPSGNTGNNTKKVVSDIPLVLNQLEHKNFFVFQL